MISYDEDDIPGFNYGVVVDGGAVATFWDKTVALLATFKKIALEKRNKARKTDPKHKQTQRECMKRYYYANREALLARRRLPEYVAKRKIAEKIRRAKKALSRTLSASQENTPPIQEGQQSGPARPTRNPADPTNQP